MITSRFWKKAIIGVLILGIAVFGFLEYRYRTLLRLPHNGSEQLTLFTILEGSRMTQIATDLEEKDFIASAWAFEKYVKRQGRQEDFLAGRFYLAQNRTIPDIASKLLDSAKREEFVTIPEGLSLEQIDARLTEKGYINAGDFVSCVLETCQFSGITFLPEDRTKWEGYFFPETYAVFPDNFDPALLGKKMLQEFEKRATELKILEREDLEDIVVMASMIEKESRHDPERPVISGILWKRLEEGWTLGVDATVRYALEKWNSALTAEDLQTENPYNTRLYTGLPPTAICNPSEASLAAAANPENSEYYYYLHGSDGEIYYATTNDEHNANKQRYL